MRKKYSNTYIDQLKFGFVIVALITLSKTSFGQNYNVVAIGTLGMSPIKIEGKITKDTSEVKMTFSGQTANYRIIKEVNGITYLTDDIKTFELHVYPATGKILGRKYNSTVNFISDKGTAVYFVTIE